MPQGEGTYGNQVGRPAKKKKKEEDSSTDGKTLLTSVRKKEKEY